MKNRGIGVFIFFLGIFSFSAQGDWKFRYQGADFIYLYRSSAILENGYFQVANQLRFHPRWVNLDLGLEVDFTDQELRRYFLEERLKINPRNQVVVRLNHLEYPDWEVGVNIINLYYQQILAHLNWALGLSYHSENFTGYYSDPFLFNSRISQLRVIYSVSYAQGFLNNKLFFRVGGENFTRFENYGYDHLGPFIQLGWNVNRSTSIWAKADFRIVGIGNGLPHLERETYFVGVRWINFPKSASK